MRGDVNLQELFIPRCGLVFGSSDIFCDYLLTWFEVLLVDKRRSRRSDPPLGPQTRALRRRRDWLSSSVGRGWNDVGGGSRDRLSTGFGGLNTSDLDDFQGFIVQLVVGV